MTSYDILGPFSPYAKSLKGDVQQDVTGVKKSLKQSLQINYRTVFFKGHHHKSSIKPVSAY
jgi:hypothetical protein